MIDMQVIEDTENRYSERKSPRETTARKIETRPLLEVDEPERVEKRMSRTGQPQSADRLSGMGRKNRLQSRPRRLTPPPARIKS